MKSRDPFLNKYAPSAKRADDPFVLPLKRDSSSRTPRNDGRTLRRFLLQNIVNKHGERGRDRNRDERPKNAGKLGADQESHDGDDRIQPHGPLHHFGNEQIIFQLLYDNKHGEDQRELDEPALRKRKKERWNGRHNRSDIRDELEKRGNERQDRRVFHAQKGKPEKHGKADNRAQYHLPADPEPQFVAHPLNEIRDIRHALVRHHAVHDFFERIFLHHQIKRHDQNQYERDHAAEQSGERGAHARNRAAHVGARDSRLSCRGPISG